MPRRCAFQCDFLETYILYYFLLVDEKGMSVQRRNCPTPIKGKVLSQQVARDFEVTATDAVDSVNKWKKGGLHHQEREEREGATRTKEPCTSIFSNLETQKKLGFVLKRDDSSRQVFCVEEGLLHIVFLR